MRHHKQAFFASASGRPFVAFQFAHWHNGRPALSVNAQIGNAIPVQGDLYPCLMETHE